MNDLDFAKKVIIEIQKKAEKNVEKGYGPFFAQIYDENRNLIAESSNSVVNTNCSNNHAEMNAIRLAEEKLQTYDLSKYNLSIYISAEPCMMCLGAILWSGIKNIYYSVSTEDVEKITGFDEGFKPGWKPAFEARNIGVFGGIEEDLGKQVLLKYVKNNKIVYKPER